jgi:hypothetical protein
MYTELDDCQIINPIVDPRKTNDRPLQIINNNKITILLTDGTITITYPHVAMSVGIL